MVKQARVRFVALRWLLRASGVYVANEKGRSILTPLSGDSPFSNVDDNNNIKAADTDPVLLVTGNVLSKPGEEESEVEESEVAGNQLAVTSYQLEQNYPNPFNPSTMISFALPEAGKVTVSIYSEIGQLVRELVNGEMPAGRHEISWNGRNQAGEVVAAGMYLYRLVVHGANGEAVFTQTRRMAFVK